jgi:hypothetical protein
MVTVGQMNSTLSQNYVIYFGNGVYSLCVLVVVICDIIGKELLSGEPKSHRFLWKNEILFAY